MESIQETIKAALYTRSFKKITSLNCVLGKRIFLPSASTTSKVSYADAVRNDENISTKIQSNDFSELKNMLTTLLEQMSNMMNLLTTVITNLDCNRICSNLKLSQQPIILMFFLYPKHVTNKSYVSIPNYNIYSTKHPAGSARGGTIDRSHLQ